MITAPAVRLSAHVLPGVFLSMGLAVAAMELRRLPGFGSLSPAILAILLGIVLRQVIGSPSWCVSGLAFSVRRLLRFGVILLGLQVTIADILSLGGHALIVVLASLVVCFVGTEWLGRRMGVPAKLTRLIAAGTSVCGASAVAAVNSVTHGEQEDVGYAMAAVTVFGTVAMLVTPALVLALHLNPTIGGLWIGTSLHEVAQVVGAATQLPSPALETATIAKLTRVLFMAPLVLCLVIGQRQTQEKTMKIDIPWFVFCFLGLVALSSLHLVPAAIIAPANQLSGFLLATALAAMGMGIHVQTLCQKGLRPALLAAVSWVWMTGISFGLITLLG